MLLFALNSHQNDVVNLARNYDHSVIKTSSHQQPATNGAANVGSISSGTANAIITGTSGLSNSSITGVGSKTLISSQRRSSLRRGSWNTNNNNCNTSLQHEIPRFYYPNGPGVRSLEVETQVRKIKSEFDKLPGKKATRPEMARIVRACNLPLYWKDPLFYAITDAVFAPFTSTITPANTSANNKSNTSASSITSSSDTKQQPQINNINNQNELLKNGLNKQHQQPSTKSVITCDEFIDYWKRLVVCCAHFIIMV